MTLLIECLAIIIVFTIIVIPVALINPKYIIGDYPPKIIEKCVELNIIPKRKSRFTKREIMKKIIALILFIIVFSYVVYRFNGADTFIKGFINSYIIWFSVCWYDALILDCILFCNIKKFRIPGTEDMKEYKDYWFHIRGSIRGSLIGIPACVLVGLLVMIF